MKKITFIGIVALLVMTASCRKQLDLEPHKIYYENFYQTEADALSAVNAVYDVLGQVNMYNGSLWMIQDIGSDDCNARPTLNDPNLREFQSYSIGPNNNYIAGIWQESYLGISRANIVLEKVPPISMDSALKQRVLGEAYFLRGLFYFNMVRLFGDVPLILRPTTADLTIEELYPPRTAAVNVYEQIISDLKMAAERLPASYSKSADKGRATHGAATGMLSKVYMTQHNWAEARNASLIVIESGTYSLWPDYTDNFKQSKINGVESVFEVQFYSKVTTENSRIVISGLPVLPAVFPAGVGIMTPTTGLLDDFEEGDYRKPSTFFDNYWGYTFDPHIWKHWDQQAYKPSETGQSGANFQLMRFSEVLLIFAEAENELSGPTGAAYDAVNQVRARARNGNPDVLPDLAGLSQDQFREAVLKERRHEFVNEGQRWYDLVRTSNLVEFVKRAKGDQANPQSFNYLFPVPQRERDLNTNLSQNPGY